MTTSSPRRRGLSLRVPPPLVALAVGVLMGIAGGQTPALSADLPGHRFFALVLAAAGIVLALAGVRAFHRVNTTIHPNHPERTSTLVTTGVYRFSRNPMYVGLALVLAGWALWLANLAAAALVAVFVVYMNRFQITPEEQAMAGLFGDRYDAYRASVRRWL